MTAPTAHRRGRGKGPRRLRLVPGSIEHLSRQPADLALEDYLATCERDIVARLIREFGEAAALRILNGRAHG